MRLKSFNGPIQVGGWVLGTRIVWMVFIIVQIVSTMRLKHVLTTISRISQYKTEIDLLGV